MDQLLSFLSLGWVGTILGIIGICMSAYFYILSKSAPKPSFQKSALRLLGRKENNLPDDVKVSFKGREVDRLTKTTLVIWNNGTQVIDGTNIIASDPLQLSWGVGDNILSHSIQKVTKETNRFQITKSTSDPHKLILYFDYLDPCDGGVIEIIHDSINKYPDFTGTIKGIPQGFSDLGIIDYADKNRFLPRPINYLLQYQKTIFTFGIIVGLCLILFGIMPTKTIVPLQNFLGISSCNRGNTSSIPVILGILYIAPPAMLLFYRRRKHPRILTPE